MTTNTDELIKSLPSQWRCMPLKQYFEFGKGLPITKADLIDEGEKVISYGQVHAKYNTGVHVDDQLIRHVSSDYLMTNKSSLCSKGNFIFADTSEDREGCGNAVYIDTDTPIFAGYHTIILRSDKNNKYLAYLFLSDGWRSQIRRRVQGIKVFSITQKILSQCQIWLPPVSEQQAISDYLDDRCSKIDEIIAEATASIEEYKELKQAVIFEAVTKGLDKTVLMKDSGIPWIGKMPEHWQLSRIKNECDNLDNLREPIRADNRENKLGLYDYYGASGVIDKIDDFNVDDTVLLIGEDGANLRMRNLPLIYLASGRFWVNNHAHILKVKEHQNSYMFMAYMLEAGDYNDYITGSAQPKLSQFNLMRFPIVHPPLDEQLKIEAYLNKLIPEYDALISEKQSLIDDLQAYKKSLIYEVVTGKRRVV